MNNLNYHHLWHFYIIAREDGLRAAAEHLMISASTLSEQLKALEAAVGGALFEREGRKLRLSALGRHVYAYAERIFRTGTELMESVHDGEFENRLPLRIGVVNAMSKLVVYQILAPLLAVNGITDEDALGEDGENAAAHRQLVSMVTVLEDEAPRLLANLANDQLDVVLSDCPVSPLYATRLFNHRLGGSALGIFVSDAMYETMGKGVGRVTVQECLTEELFPSCLDRQPFLMPTKTSALSRELERWFDKHAIQPLTYAQFENSALLEFFASRGHGAFAAPMIAVQHLEKQYSCRFLGPMEDVDEQYYAITSGRRIKHPGVIRIHEIAQGFMASGD